MYILSPSILAADFKQLGNEIKKADKSGAGYIHIDVMDGNFVPSISFGMPVISSVRCVTDKIFDVHLMVTDPERYIEDFAACGADLITVHVEACKDLDHTIGLIRESGRKVGVALNPATPLSSLEYVLEKTDMVLIMTVNPGFGGQKYIESCTQKISNLRKIITERSLKVDIQVDGGIDRYTVRKVLDAGANIIVAGSAVFGEHTEENIKAFLDIFQEYEA